MSGEGILPNDPRPTEQQGALPGVLLAIVREAVAETQRSGGLAHLADRTIAGELDSTPMVQAAATAVARAVLRHG